MNHLIEYISSEKQRTIMSKLLPNTISVDQYLAAVVVEFKKNPALEECSPQSFWSAVMCCCETGLLPSSSLGYAYLIPFGKECTFVVGYHGLVKLLRDSGRLEAIRVRFVFEEDEFWVEEKDGVEHIYFKPHSDSFHRKKEDGKLVYAIIKMKGEEGYHYVMAMDEILTIREAALKNKKHPQSSPWWAHFEAMAMKTVLRRCCRLLRGVSPQLTAGMVYDNDLTSEINPVKEHPAAMETETSAGAVSEEEGYNGRNGAGDAIHAQIGKMKAVLDERRMVS